MSTGKVSLRRRPGCKTYQISQTRQWGDVDPRTRSRYRPMVSSSQPKEDDEPNEYVFGSFIVADDADLLSD